MSANTVVSPYRRRNALVSCWNSCLDGSINSDFALAPLWPAMPLHFGSLVLIQLGLGLMVMTFQQLVLTARLCALYVVRFPLQTVSVMKKDRCQMSARSQNGTLTAIDLFCGAGGLSEGFKKAGFEVLAGNDFDEAAGTTFKATHGDTKFFSEPIEKLPVGALLSAAKIRLGDLDCLIGGPPCQAYSVYNHQRGMHDERSQLFREYLRLVEGINPKWVFLENVTGILSAGGGFAVRAIVGGLEKLGYHVEHRILKAEEYGVPQERRRVVFLGCRTGSPIVWPNPTHGPELKPFVTIADAISDLPPLLNGENPGPQSYSILPVSAYQASLRSSVVQVHNHSAPRLSATNLERMKYIQPGGSWRDLPFDLLPEGMKKAKRSDHTKRYGRMRWDKQSCTILTKCDVHWGAYIHPDQDRSISVREAARLQSFPDNFVFQGSRTEQYVQVGNAVPPILGEVLAVAIKVAGNSDVSPVLQAAA